MARVTGQRGWAERRRCAARGAMMVAALGLVAGIAGCDDPMANQPHHEALERSDFYPDHRASRHPPSGTVARGSMDDDIYRTEYRSPDDPLPVELSMETLDRGRQRYEINCIMCHGGAGDGRGIIPARGFTTPTSYHIDRLRAAPLAHFVEVIEKGAGRMPSYAAQVSPHDRWAIALYIRALQLSHDAPREALSPDDLRALAKAPAEPAESSPPPGEAEPEPPQP